MKSYDIVKYWKKLFLRVENLFNLIICGLVYGSFKSNLFDNLLVVIYFILMVGF